MSVKKLKSDLPLEGGDHAYGIDDLILIGVGNRMLLGFVNGLKPDRALVGDVEHIVPAYHGFIVHRKYYLPGAGKLVGKSFGSLAEVREALRPFRKGAGK